jgi:DNA-binding NarL/FixJ family response regulator
MAGARGWICKPESPSAITSAIDKALAGSITFCSRSEKVLINCFHLLGKNFNDGQLTQRENEIMVLICQQKSDKEISTTLRIGVGTVHAHVSHLFKKLHVHTRGEAAQKVMSFTSGPF